MSRLTLQTGNEAEFFQRGRQLAAMADAGTPLPEESTLSFEDPAEITRLMTASRLALFRAVKEMPGSITQISERLHRDRSAVKRDIDEMAHAGILSIAEKTLPGHGRMKEIRATASRLRLMAEIG